MRLEWELEAEDVKGIAKTVLGELRDLQEVDTMYTGIGWDKSLLVYYILLKLCKHQAM